MTLDLILALSGGGAAGLGHIPVLCALDEAGKTPDALAGASIGALIGALYASGMTGVQIRDHVVALHDHPSKLAAKLWSGLSLRSTVLPLDPAKVLDLILPDTLPERFEDLDIPLTVLATDYHARAPIAFGRGNLRNALAASIAIPGVFRPVNLDGRVYVDGGVTNNLPLDHLPKARLSIAVDVASEPPEDSDEVPGPLAASLGSMRIMMREMLSRTLSSHPPDILIEPESRRFGALEFRKVPQILDACDHAFQDTLDALKKLEG